MYEELIETLRETSDKRMHEAADAIEELAKDLERSKDYESFWEKEANEALRKFKVAVANKPHWIPVAERLPSENGFFLCLYNHKHPGGVAMDGGLSILQWFCGRWNLNEIYTVTHWMSLPQPPKEETA